MELLQGYLQSRGSWKQSCFVLSEEVHGLKILVRSPQSCKVKPLALMQAWGRVAPQNKGGSHWALPSCHWPDPWAPSSAEETFPFTSSTLHPLRQQEWLEWEDQCRAAALVWNQRCPPSSWARLTRPRHSCDPAVYSVLISSDLQQVQALFQDEDTANMIVETVSNQLAWSPEQGFWVLTPKTKQTVPFTIAVAQGYTNCASHLIWQRAQLGAWVGGPGSLAPSLTVRLLLTFSAKVNVLSEEGTTPLHLCTASGSLQYAKMLLETGATMNVAVRDSKVTLHVVAARGLEEHVALYLERGTNVSLCTSRGETALNAACLVAEGLGSGKHQAVARQLLEAGADVWAVRRRCHTLQHNFCANGYEALAELLLRHGIYAGVPSAAGHTPMDCVLQTVQDAPNWEPEVLFTAGLDCGAQPVHPEEHEAFYSSAPAMVNQPRQMQHLARLAVRAHLGNRC
ncbi:LOW QUALITY PROTEIN: ankyrin repeat and SOCS box protein 16 [Molossus nigricans]